MHSPILISTKTGIAWAVQSYLQAQGVACVREGARAAKALAKERGS